MDDVKIALNNVSKSFDDKKILEKIDMELRNGEFVSMVGPSGCGKSTIFNIITGLVKSDGGEVAINGDYSYMYQKDLLLPYKTIVDNVALPMLIKTKDKKKAREEAKKLFPVFGLEGYENSIPSELSGGMRQRANFMRTFINSHDIMLLDEPFGALDSMTRASMQKWLLNLKKTLNASILLITHDIEEAIILSDRIYILSDKPTKILKMYDLSEITDKTSPKNITNLKYEILKEMNI